jgi:ferredoxin-NADP reductase
VPSRAQAGLPEDYIARGLFLACQCLDGDLAGELEVAPAEGALARFEVEVRAVEVLDERTRALHLDAPQGYVYRAGQFVELFRDERTRRNYSLASVPGLDHELALHVRRVPGGEVSGWIFGGLRAGARVTISEASGRCCYAAGHPGDGLLLIGTGTGIAPLFAIARDALHQGHRGPVLLVHGSRDAGGLYLDTAARRLAAQHGNLRYRPWIGADPAGAVEHALREQADLAGWRVFLCGNARTVEAARLRTFLAGAAVAQIFADPFLPSGPGHDAGTGRP